MLEQFIFSLGVIGPVFLLILLGIILKFIGLIDDKFVTQSSKLVFKIALPALIISKLSKTDFAQTFDLKIIYVAIVLTIMQFLIGWSFSKLLTKNPSYKGVFVQGSFRSNFAIIGLAILSNYFGSEILGKATIILAAVMPLYNILSVIALLMPHHSFSVKNIKKIVQELFTNPLILSVFIALPFSYHIIPMPTVIGTSLNYLSMIALPLALIGIGATFNFKSLKKASALSFASSGLKIILFPVLCIYISILLGFRGADLGILFIVFGAPTAIASFVMADAMKGDRKLAADIIVISSLFSLFTLSLGFTLLNHLGYL